MTDRAATSAPDVAIAHVTGLLTAVSDRHQVLDVIVEHTRSGYEAASAAVVSSDRPHVVVVEAAEHGHSVGDLIAVSSPAALCVRSDSVILLDDLADTEVAPSRWTEYRRRATGLGVRGVRAWPLRVSGQPVGALIVHTATTWPPATSGLFGQTMADLAALALSAPRAGSRDVDADTVDTLITTTAVVDAAVGMLAAMHSVDIDDARAMLRQEAVENGTDVGAYARLLVRERGLRRRS